MQDERGLNTSEEDRRGYFRIEDTVHLDFDVISPESLSDRLAQLENGNNNEFTVTSSLSVVTQEMAGVLRRIDADTPDVARYLSAIDRKIDLLARAMLAQTGEISHQSARTVNISASGMAFHTSEPLAAGDLLELKLLLLPSYTGILVYGEVLGCDRSPEPLPASGYQVRVNFCHLRDDDRDVLIKHVLHRQSAMLRQQREAREATTE